MSSAKPNFREILRVLDKHQAASIVIGGACAVIHGAPVLTFDLDLVHQREPANVQRLVAALDELDAWYRQQKTRKLRPTPDLLAGDGHHLLMTTAGPLDLLGTIENSQSYDDLLARSVEIDIEPRLRVRVLDLPTLILLKRAGNREKDKLMLPILERLAAKSREPD